MRCVYMVFMLVAVMLLSGCTSYGKCVDTCRTINSDYKTDLYESCKCDKCNVIVLEGSVCKCSPSLGDIFDCNEQAFDNVTALCHDECRGVV